MNYYLAALLIGTGFGLAFFFAVLYQKEKKRSARFKKWFDESTKAYFDLLKEKRTSFHDN